jgi:hypothetical protein
MTDTTTENVITTTELGHRLGFQFSTMFIINELGVTPHLTTKTEVYWREGDVGRILIAVTLYLAKKLEESLSEAEDDVLRETLQ